MLCVRDNVEAPTTILDMPPRLPPDPQRLDNLRHHERRPVTTIAVAENEIGLFVVLYHL